MKNFKKIMLLFMVAFTIFSCKTNKETAKVTLKKKPNVLLLFSDQHNKKVMGFENHPDVITPNFDKLAQEAVVFDRAYCTRGICAPSRTSLMTSLYPRTLGLFDNEATSSVITDAVSMATIFKFNDYNTYTFGKRHLYGGADLGWDVKKDIRKREGDNGNYVQWVTEQGYANEFSQDWAAEFGRGIKGTKEFKEKLPTADLGTRLSKLPEGYTMEAYTALETINMIQQQKDSDKPFFCWSSFYRPHQPYTPLKKYMNMYNVSNWGAGRVNGGSIKMPESFYQPTKDLPPLLQFQRNGGNKVWNMDKAFKDEQLWRNYIGAYYALVSELDHYVGEILKALDAADMQEETIVIYTTDHGDFVGNHGMVEKASAGHNVYEDILNVPLIIKIPGKTTKGKHTAELVSLVDILPTLVEALDLKVPELKHKFEGISLLNLLEKDKPLDRNFIVSEGWFQSTVITKNDKLGIMKPSPVNAKVDYTAYGDMYFNTIADPLEINNGVKQAENKERIAQLRNYYTQFEKQIPGVGMLELLAAKK